MLGSPVEEGHGKTEVCAAKGYKDDKAPGASDRRSQAESVGLFSIEERRLREILEIHTNTCQEGLKIHMSLLGIRPPLGYS